MKTDKTDKKKRKKKTPMEQKELLILSLLLLFLVLPALVWLKYGEIKGSEALAAVPLPSPTPTPPPPSEDELLLPKYDFAAIAAAEKTGPVVVLDGGRECLKLFPLVEEALGSTATVYRIAALPEMKKDADKLDFLKSCSADLYIRVSIADDDSASAATFASCNTEYYIPGLDGIVLADMMESKVLGKIDSPAGDIVPVDAQDMIKKLSIPACALQLGWQADENGYFDPNDEGYLSSAAEGIAGGIRAALNLME